MKVVNQKIHVNDPCLYLNMCQFHYPDFYALARRLEIFVNPRVTLKEQNSIVPRDACFVLRAIYKDAR